MAPQWVRKQTAKEPEQLIGLRVKARGLPKQLTDSAGTVVKTAITDHGPQVAIRWDEDGTLDWLTPTQWEKFIVRL